jgi:FKBP-type peptidyl-prolyl cis-trans isomerase FkpA
MLATVVAVTAGCSAAPQSTTPATAPVPTQEATPAAPAPAAEASPAVTALVIKDTKVGKGAKVKAGDTVSVHYTGWLMDGTKFDSSVDRGTPFDFVVGQGSVIQGWDQGLIGMKVGGKRTLIIPSDLGYGPQGTPDGTIPPNAPLKFDIQLLKITPA